MRIGQENEGMFRLRTAVVIGTNRNIVMRPVARVPGRAWSGVSTIRNGTKSQSGFAIRDQVSARSPKRIVTTRLYQASHATPSGARIAA